MLQGIAAEYHNLGKTRKAKAVLNSGLERSPTNVNLMMELANIEHFLGEELDAARLAQAMDGIPADDFTLLLYHSPDLIVEAAQEQIDLYLGGHTHGGQLRLPLYGALVTGTASGKRYEMGRYDLGGTLLYVSRGVGMEGMAAPRARFLSPPEIVCVDVVGTAPPGA